MDNLHKHSGGFTLIEIMVVIILVSIAGALVFVNIGKSGRMKESRMFAEKLTGLCRRARVLALSGARPVCLLVSPGERVCRLGGEKEISVTGDKKGEEPFSGNHLEIPEHIRIEGEGIRVNQAGVAFICFYPDSSSSGGILTVSVEDGFSFSFQVDILTGGIRQISMD